MKLLIYIFLGGGTGSVLRYLISTFIARQCNVAFPWGTLAINTLGCLLIGMFYSLSPRVHPDTRLMLTVGLCGGFTTFSTFSNECLQLLKDGAYPSFIAYAAGSMVLGIGSVMLGAWIGK